MNIIKAIINASYRIFAVVMALIGIGIIILAFVYSFLMLKIAIALVGLGFISFGLVQVKRAQDRKRDKEKLEQLVTKLDEIQQELKKEDKPGGGVAIADVLASGLKYYSEHLTKPEKEDSND
jgi:3'-phosphoadenosine 5'-phosphosulfate (PAPS) 3'-phosphatase